MKRHEYEPFIGEIILIDNNRKHINSNPFQTHFYELQGQSFTKENCSVGAQIFLWDCAQALIIWLL